MAYKREQRVFLYLGKKGYLTRKTTPYEDIRNKVDLVAHRDGTMFFVQVKSPIDFMSPKELSEFSIYCHNKKAKGLLAVVNKNSISIRRIR
jgi:hypothetical protein